MQKITLSSARSFLNDRALLFVFKVIAVYITWKFIHYYLVTSNGTLHQYWIQFTIILGSYYAAITSAILNLFGEGTVQNGIAVTYIKNPTTILVEDHCLAIPSMVIFTGSIALFSGSWKDKLWFIPLGLFGIAIINITRLVLVCIAFHYFSRQFYEINHSFVYVVITYSLILMMIVWWMKRFDTSVAKPK